MDDTTMVKVPLMPTERMIEEGAKRLTAVPCWPKEDIKAVWVAMIKAMRDEEL